MCYPNAGLLRGILAGLTGVGDYEILPETTETFFCQPGRAIAKKGMAEKG
ncbi:hypothetical protein [Nostoc sp. NOS(2021)]|nr:hypothetical protein [Nostoc sp. NOS(2021)]